MVKGVLMADTKTPMQKQREQRRAQGWRDVNVWLTPEGQHRIARLMEPGESLSTLIDRALVALEAFHSGGTTRSLTSKVTSEQPEDLQVLIEREVSRYLTSDRFRDNLFIPLMKQTVSSYLPSDLTRYLTSEPITIPALPVHSSAARIEVPGGKDQKTAVLSRLRAMQAEGLSLQAIANQLNAEGVPTLSGKGHWQKGTIANLLKE
jgi:hypothetical protein